MAHQVPTFTVIMIEHPQGARPAHLYGTIHRAGLRGRSSEVASYPPRPFCRVSPTSGLTASGVRAVHYSDGQSAESVHADARHSGRSSGSTICSAGRQRVQPGEAQGAPESGLSMHRGSQTDADGRVGALPAWVGDPVPATRGWSGTVFELVGRLGRLRTNGGRVGCF